MILDVSCLSGEAPSVGAIFHWVVALWYGLPPGRFEDGVADLSVPPLFGGFDSPRLSLTPSRPLTAMPPTLAPNVLGTRPRALSPQATSN
jgi:hypothetical protein